MYCIHACEKFGSCSWGRTFRDRVVHVFAMSDAEDPDLGAHDLEDHAIVAHP